MNRMCKIFYSLLNFRGFVGSEFFTQSNVLERRSAYLTPAGSEVSIMHVCGISMLCM